MSTLNRLSFLSKRHESGDVYTFSFSRPANFKHKAGQHGLLLLPGLYRPHPFTLSSSPSEGHVSITTHVGTGSRYKRRLMNLQPGNLITMLGPVLNFTFDQSAKKYVFLAQGIGVTPFRSMLVYAQANSLDIQTTLIHVDSERHTFKETTQSCATTAYYPTSADEFGHLVGQQDSNQLFYLSGSPKFVSSTKQLLKEQGVIAQNIRTDSFLGY